jgi:hypothetical protein
MLGKVLKTTTAPPHDQLRVALAECILDRNAKAKATGLAREAVSKSNDLVSDAERHAEAVKIALASARDGREARLREAVEGGGVIEKPASTREARFAEQDAADELAAAKSVLTNCMASLAFAADAEQWAQRKVEAAAAPVLGLAADRLIADADTMKKQLDAQYALLAWVERLLPPGDAVRQRVALSLPPGPPPGVHAVHYRSLPAPPEWLSTLDALMQNADSPLPGSTD